ncbi:MAG: hypothetical protein WBO70_05520 [Erysipelotrichaceae bacterium]
MEKLSRSNRNVNSYQNLRKKAEKIEDIEIVMDLSGVDVTKEIEKLAERTRKTTNKSLINDEFVEFKL